MTFVIESQQSTWQQGRMHVEILMTILKLCLQNNTETKLDINLDILRTILEVVEELEREYLLKLDEKKSSAENIISEKEKLRAPY